MRYRLVTFASLYWVYLITLILAYVVISMWSPLWLFSDLSPTLTRLVHRVPSPPDWLAGNILFAVGWLGSKTLFAAVWLANRLPSLPDWLANSILFGAVWFASQVLFALHGVASGLGALTLFDLFSLGTFLSVVVLSCASSVMVQTTPADYPRMCPLTAFRHFLRHPNTLPLLPLVFRVRDKGHPIYEPVRVAPRPEDGRQRPSCQRWLLLLVLLCVLGGGYLLLHPVLGTPEASTPGRDTVLFATVAFSIAFAIHYFSVSIALSNLVIRERRGAPRRQLRELEYGVVTSGLLVLGGGLTLLLAGTFSLLVTPVVPFPYLRPPFVAAIYTMGAGTLFSGYLRYTFSQSGWARAAARLCDS